MWEKEKKHIGVKILLVLLILALLAGLYYVYMQVKAREEVQDAALLDVYFQHQQELAEAKQANYDAVEALYQADLDAVSKYLPGIVCWGDVTTTGSAGSVSFPDKLQELIDAAIVDKYDFRKTLETTEGLGRISDWSVYTVDIPVINMGGGKENTATIAGRNGSVPFIVSEAFTIPATTERVPIKIKSSGDSILNSLLPAGTSYFGTATTVTPLTQGDAGINPVIINGVEGTLSLDTEVYYYSKRTNYSFARLQSGAAVEVEEGTVITTAASSMYRDYIPVIFTGTYDDQQSTAEQLIAFQKEIINHQIANKDRYIIIGLYCMDQRWDKGRTQDLEVFETAMMQEYGDHYIDLYKYLLSDALTDAEITMTNIDYDDIRYHKVPMSLRSTSDESQLNALAYPLIGKIVFDRMDKLGYFQEVKDELGITAIEKEQRQAAAKVTPKPY